MRKAKLAVATLMAVALVGCGKSEEKSPNPNANVNVDQTDKEVVDTTKTEVNYNEETVSKEEVKDYQTSTKENDTDMGLRNMKVDVAAGLLSEDQIKLIDYFKSDYFDVNSVETLLRYPDIFEDAQVSMWCKVGKVIKSDQSGYQILCYLLENSEETWDDLSGNPNRYIIIDGKQNDKRFIAGDVINLFGRYHGTESVEVDGVSNIMPAITVHSAYLQNHDAYFYPSRMTMAEVKQVAKAIFGDNITIRMASSDKDEDIYDTDPPQYTCVLDNQSNAKLNKFYFNERFGTLSMPYDPTYERTIEFAPDCKHFFLFSVDHELETLLIEYYDQNLNKIWKKEIEQTVNATYDFTKHNLYLVANNDLIILDMETGENTFEPSYVGEKVEVRKMKDGIILVSKNKSDGIMKTDLQGKILWKTNLSNDIERVSSIQLIEDKIIVVARKPNWEMLQMEDLYIVLDATTGDIIQSQEIFTDIFQQFS